MTGSEHGVVIAGGGPTGLMLAVELTLAGADVVVVERRTSQELDGSRAGGLHARTIEILDMRGVVDRFLGEGRTHPMVGFAGAFLDMSDLPTRHAYLLGLWQSRIERLLADWSEELGVSVLRGREVTGLSQDADGVDVELSDGTALRAAYLIGCDGGRSVVRKAAGIEFAGWDATSSYLIAELEMEVAPEIGMRPEGGGVGPVDPAAEAGPYRVVLLEKTVDHDREPTLQDVRDALTRAYGTDYGAHSPTWVSRFTDTCRQAVSYRTGRVLVAGDAAHVHGPQGGQGLNVGLQDAVNLGWKLAQVVAGTSPDCLLDTYHAERHPVGARVLQNTMAQVALSRIDERSRALRELTLGVLAMDEPRRSVAGMISGLDVHYDLGECHPLVGRRLPDLDLVTGDGAVRAFSLLRDGRGALLDLGMPPALDPSPWSDRVRVVAATVAGTWELPVVGSVEPPSAVLVRPDGYVAWTGNGTTDELHDALTTWFGPR